MKIQYEVADRAVTVQARAMILGRTYRRVNPTKQDKPAIYMRLEQAETRTGVPAISLSSGLTCHLGPLEDMIDMDTTLIVHGPTGGC